ncbi:MAG: heavy metal-responsive transcriptional regulator [Rhodanobacter sp. SCN 68-63]|nr:MAG: heavy metal-responsive transcriptional regulator [Rhodanobacter sp. SCN 68-63]
MSAFTIGKVAQHAGVGVETVRFYMREGLLPEPPPRGLGFRTYPPETVQRLQFIQRAKQLGFSLKEIRELLELRVSPQMTCADVRGMATAKVADIEDRIRDLQRMRKALRALAEHCQGSGPISDCPILDHLAKGDCDDA